MKVFPITFQGKPANYAKIDKFVSRSAQPMKEDFAWLKENGVTDIINFRTMIVAGLDFDEKATVESLGMNYHNIPSVTKNPDEEKVIEFLKIIDKIKNNNGKAHIHCQAGADRTGMYAFIYKTLNGLGAIPENIAEWINFGHNTKLYPNLISQTEELLKKLELYNS